MLIFAACQRSVLRSTAHPETLNPLCPSNIEERARVRVVAATVEEMEEKGRALHAKGVRFPTDKCQDQKGKNHLCFEIDVKAADFSSPDSSRHYRVPKGF